MPNTPECAINVSISKILKDNYIEGGDSWITKTNIELLFSNNNDSIKLIQGETGYLLDYKIHLGLARQIEYRKDSNIINGGMPGISFTILKQ